MLIDIVLTTYNGQEFLREQIESIQNCEGYSEFIRKLIICDDGSNDNTLEIITQFTNNDSKIELIKNNTGKPFRVVRNFSRGIQISQAKLIMLADQDDVWSKDKIVSLYAFYQLKNSTHRTPLVFSDLYVVDQNLDLINRSFMLNQNFNVKEGTKFERLLLQNIAPGCTMLIDSEVAREALSIENELILMHDWWLMIYASFIGHVAYFDRPLIRYRQHLNNQVGAIRDDIHPLKKIVNIYNKVLSARKVFNSIINQASIFKDYTEKNNIKPDKDYKLNYLQVIYKIDNGFVLFGLKYFLFHGFRRHGIIRNIPFLLNIVFNGMIHEKK